MDAKIFRKINPFYKKHKEIFLYLFFGFLAFIVSVGSFTIFNVCLKLNEHISNILSWVLAVLFAFFTNRGMVFNSKTDNKKDFIKQITSFFSGRLVTLGIEELIIFIFITKMGLNSVLIKVLVQVVVILLNYVISKLFIFNENKSFLDKINIFKKKDDKWYIKVIKTCSIVISGLIIGTLLLMLVYLLPTDIMYKNLKSSSALIHQETSYFNAYPNLRNTVQDNYTDALELSKAVYDGTESVIDKAMYAYGHQTVSDPFASLQDEMNTGIKGGRGGYTRYWHGYLLVLKPLLLIFNYNEIRYFNALFQLGLMVIVCLLLYKNNKKNFIIPYLFSMFAISFMTISKSLQYSCIFDIFNISMIIMLKYNDKLKNHYLYYFLILGMCTSYFDFLTYPIATLGMSMITYIILNNKDNKLLLKDIIIYSIMWGLGYGLMWGGKWLVGTLLTGENFFKSAMQAVETRSSSTIGDSKITYISVLYRNLGSYFSIPFIVIFVVLNIYYVIKLIKKFDINKLKCIFNYLLISMMPLAWYFVLKNHSYIHNFFTYRSLVVLLFAYLCFISSLSEGEKSNEK